MMGVGKTDPSKGKTKRKKVDDRGEKSEISQSRGQTAGGRGGERPPICKEQRRGVEGGRTS